MGKGWGWNHTVVLEVPGQRWHLAFLSTFRWPKQVTWSSLMATGLGNFLPLESGALREEWWGRMLPEPPACTWACSAVLCLVIQSCSALCDPITCQAPLSTQILQERILEWIAMPSSRVSSQPRNQTQDGPPNIGNNKTILRLIALYYIGLRGAPIWIN